MPTYDELQVDKQLQEKKTQLSPNVCWKLWYKINRTSDDTTDEKKSTLQLQIDGDNGHKEHGLEKAALISYKINPSKK